MFKSAGQSLKQDLNSLVERDLQESLRHMGVFPQPLKVLPQPPSGLDEETRRFIRKHEQVLDAMMQDQSCQNAFDLLFRQERKLTTTLQVMAIKYRNEPALTDEEAKQAQAAGKNVIGFFYQNETGVVRKNVVLSEEDGRRCDALFEGCNLAARNYHETAVKTAHAYAMKLGHTLGENEAEKQAVVDKISEIIRQTMYREEERQQEADPPPPPPKAPPAAPGLKKTSKVYVI